MVSTGDISFLAACDKASRLTILDVMESSLPFGLPCLDAPPDAVYIYRAPCHDAGRWFDSSSQRNQSRLHCAFTERDPGLVMPELWM